jgi:hypothetical protein
MVSLKHVGRIKATNKRCLVAFRTLPGDAFNCLIIPTENLPDNYHDSLINLVNSPAGQDANEFADVLNRSTFPDGSTMLPALHSQGRLVKFPTDQIEMIPSSNAHIILSELNAIIAEQRGVSVSDLSVGNPKNPNVEIQEVGSAKDISPKVGEDVTKTVAERQEEAAALLLTPDQQASKLRSEADRLYKEAAKLRKEAEELSPTKKKEK